MKYGISDIIGSKRNAILGLASNYGIQDVRVFGSVARNEAEEDSDLDLLLNVSNSDYFKMVHFKYDLEEMLNRKVDVVSDRGLSPIIAPYILSEAKPL